MSATEDPFQRHRADVETSIRSGDPDAIKQSYRDLGAYLHDAYGDGERTPPQLSWPETAAVVAGAIPARAVRILDAGCGPNPATAIAIHRPDRLVIALDIGIGTVRLACATGRTLQCKLVGVVGDVEHLPLRRGCLDAAICDDTVEHVPDDAAAVRELARCLRPGGVVVVATPNRWGLQVLYRRAKDRIRGRRLPPRAYFSASSHLREYTPAELGRLLAPHFVVDRFLPVGWVNGSPLQRIGDTVVRRWPLHAFTRAVVAVGRPRR